MAWNWIRVVNCVVYAWRIKCHSEIFLVNSRQHLGMFNAVQPELNVQLYEYIKVICAYSLQSIHLLNATMEVGPRQLESRSYIVFRCDISYTWITRPNMNYSCCVDFLPYVRYNYCQRVTSHRPLKIFPLHEALLSIFHTKPLHYCCKICTS